MAAKTISMAMTTNISKSVSPLISFVWNASFHGMARRLVPGSIY